MIQYWWVNQTRNYEIERSKGLVAGEINVENNAKTHWGRKNVKEMRRGDLIVCYRSGIGIDRMAYVKENSARGLIPWDVFCWDKIPGEDNGRLLKYLTKGVGIDWMKNAKIEKIDNGKTINISNKIKSLSLKLNDSNSEVVLEIDDDEIKLIKRWENDKLNIYQENSKDRRAFITNVDYISGLKSINKEAFWDNLKDMASGKNEPIDLIRTQIRYAYAMNIQKNAFDKILCLIETVNPGIANELSQRFGYDYKKK